MEGARLKYNYTKETAKNCPRYEDSNINGCMFSPTYEEYGKEHKAGVWCMECMRSVVRESNQ